MEAFGWPLRTADGGSRQRKVVAASASNFASALLKHYQAVRKIDLAALGEEEAIFLQGIGIPDKLYGELA